VDRETKKNILASFVTLRHEVEHMEERLRRLESEAVLPPMRPGNGSQSSGGGDKNERAAIRYIEYKDRAEPQIDSIRRQMREIETAIQDLPDPLERSVLEHRYTETDTIRLLKWREIAVKLYGDDDEKDIQAVYRLHNEALDHIDLEGFTCQIERKDTTT